MAGWGLARNGDWASRDRDRCGASDATKFATPSAGRNEAQPTSMIRPKVHMPRQAPMPTCSKTAMASMSGRRRGRQIKTQKEISHRTETWVMRLRSQG